MRCLSFPPLLLILEQFCAVSGTLADCDVYTDICSSANSTSLHENYYRSKNCIYNSTLTLCDQSMDWKWYKSDVDILTNCPSSLECGAPFPLWLNGALPSEVDGTVTRSVCKRGVGPQGCCVKTYDIKIKNCGAFMAYCLTPPADCSERYCFGLNGTCDVPDRTTETTTVRGSPGEDGEGTIVFVAVSFTLIGVILVIAFALKYFTLKKLPFSISKVSEQQHKSNFTPR